MAITRIDNVPVSSHERFGLDNVKARLGNVEVEVQARQRICDKFASLRFGLETLKQTH